MSLKNNHSEYTKEIADRKIQYLIHFTPTINLYSILEHKSLLSRESLENIDVDNYDILDYIQFTDNIRYDDKSFINLSISSPNTFLLSKFIERTRDDVSISWCILKIDPKHIYDDETLFSVTNAASVSAQKQYKIKGDIDTFSLLFNDKLIINNNQNNRELTRGSIKNKYPTDIQAEVLVKNTIPISSIISICFVNDTQLAEAKAAMIEFNTDKFIVDPLIFNPNRNSGC